MIKIFGMVIIAAAIAFSSPAVSVAVEKPAAAKKVQKKKCFRSALRSSLAFVGDSIVFGTSQER